jgi:MoxR-like ATPase
MSYPSAAEERAIIATTTTSSDPEVSPVAGADDLLRARRLVRDVPAADNVIDYATRLVRATRPGDAAVAPSVTRWVRWGAGPRAGQALVLAAKARAVVHGRPAVSLDDIRTVAPPVLRHRVLVNFQAIAEGITSERVVADVLAGVAVHR